MKYKVYKCIGFKLILITTFKTFKEAYKFASDRKEILLIKGVKNELR